MLRTDNGDDRESLLGEENRPLLVEENEGYVSIDFSRYDRSLAPPPVHFTDGARRNQPVTLPPDVITIDAEISGIHRHWLMMKAESVISPPLRATAIGGVKTVDFLFDRTKGIIPAVVTFFLLAAFDAFYPVAAEHGETPEKTIKMEWALDIGVAFGVLLVGLVVGRLWHNWVHSKPDDEQYKDYCSHLKRKHPELVDPVTVPQYEFALSTHMKVVEHLVTSGRIKAAVYALISLAKNFPFTPTCYSAPAVILSHQPEAEQVNTQNHDEEIVAASPVLQQQPRSEPFRSPESRNANIRRFMNQANVTYQGQETLSAEQQKASLQNFIEQGYGAAAVATPIAYVAGSANLDESLPPPPSPEELERVAPPRNRKELMVTDPRRYPLVSGGQVNIFRLNGLEEAPFGDVHQVELPSTFDTATVDERNAALKRDQYMEWDAVDFYNPSHMAISGAQKVAKHLNNEDKRKSHSLGHIPRLNLITLAVKAMTDSNYIDQNTDPLLRNMNKIPEQFRSQARLAIREEIAENKALLLLGLLKNPEPARESGLVDYNKTFWHNWTYFLRHDDQLMKAYRQLDTLSRSRLFYILFKAKHIEACQLLAWSLLHSGSDPVNSLHTRLEQFIYDYSGQRGSDDLEKAAERYHYVNVLVAFTEPTLGIARGESSHIHRVFARDSALAVCVLRALVTHISERDEMAIEELKLADAAATTFLNLEDGLDKDSDAYWEDRSGKQQAYLGDLSAKYDAERLMYDGQTNLRFDRAVKRLKCRGDFQYRDNKHLQRRAKRHANLLFWQMNLGPRMEVLHKFVGETNQMESTHRVVEQLFSVDAYNLEFMLKGRLLVPGEQENVLSLLLMRNFSGIAYRVLAHLSLKRERPYRELMQYWTDYVTAHITDFIPKHVHTMAAVINEVANEGAEPFHKLAPGDVPVARRRLCLQFLNALHNSTAFTAEQKQAHFYQVITEFYRGQDLWSILSELQSEADCSSELYEDMLTAMLGHVFHGEALPEDILDKMEEARTKPIEECEAMLVREINNNENLQPIEKGECFERLHRLFASNVDNVFEFQLAMRSYFLPDDERNYAIFMRWHFKYLQRPLNSDIHDLHARRYALNHHHDHALEKLVRCFVRDQELVCDGSSTQLHSEDSDKLVALRIILKELLFNSETRGHLLRCLSRIMYHSDLGLETGPKTWNAKVYCLVLLLSLVQGMQMEPLDKSVLISSLLVYVGYQVENVISPMPIASVLLLLNQQLASSRDQWLGEVSQVMSLFDKITPENFTIDSLVYLLIVNQSEEPWSSPYGLSEDDFTPMHQSEVIQHITHQFSTGKIEESGALYKAEEIGRIKKWSEVLVGICCWENKAGKRSFHQLKTLIASPHLPFLNKVNLVVSFLKEIEGAYGETSSRQKKVIYLVVSAQVLESCLRNITDEYSFEKSIVSFNEALDCLDSGESEHEGLPISIHSILNKLAVRCADELSFWTDPNMNDPSHDYVKSVTRVLRDTLWSYTSLLVGKVPLLLKTDAVSLEKLLVGFVNIGCYINKNNPREFRNWNFLVTQALFYYFSTHTQDWKNASTEFSQSILALPILMNKESDVNQLSESLVDTDDQETMVSLELNGFRKLCLILDNLQDSESLDLQLPDAPYSDFNLDENVIKTGYREHFRIDKSERIPEVKLKLATVFAVMLVIENTNLNNSSQHQRRYVGFFDNPNPAANREYLADTIYSVFHAAAPDFFGEPRKVKEALQDQRDASISNMMKELRIDDAVISCVREAVALLSDRPASLAYGGL